MPRDSEASKKKILKIAERIFAKKGFDGARVDEIAKEASVNKALIYYYFKSKTAILEEIFREFQNEATAMFFKYVNEDIDLTDLEKSAEFFDVYLAYLESRKDTLKIMLTESLKSSEKDPPIFGFMELTVEKEAEDAIKSMKEKGYTISDQREQIMVTEFFTGLMPIINYVVFKDKWAKHFDIEIDRLRNLFFQAYTDTHVAYHLREQN